MALGAPAATPASARPSAALCRCECILLLGCSHLGAPHYWLPVSQPNLSHPLRSTGFIRPRFSETYTTNVFLGAQPVGGAIDRAAQGIQEKLPPTDGLLSCVLVPGLAIVFVRCTAPRMSPTCVGLTTWPRWPPTTPTSQATTSCSPSVRYQSGIWYQSTKPRSSMDLAAVLASVGSIAS